MTIMKTILIVIGILSYLIIAIFALALCHAAKRGYDILDQDENRRRRSE